jgi:hypothetical protein
MISCLTAQGDRGHRRWPYLALLASVSEKDQRSVKGSGPIEVRRDHVGGGSAGAVLAARLSEDRARRVMPVEAGPDYPTLASTPDDLQNCRRMSLRDQ